MIKELNNPVILFDGLCNLCSASVQFILKRDVYNKYRFTSLQSDAGISLLKQFQIDIQTSPQTLILLNKGKLYTRSTAALMIASNLSGLWPLLSIFIIIPPVFRDLFYRIIASNRYNWFGKKTECWIASPEYKNLFL